MDRFAKLHPVTQFLFFALSIVLVLVVSHPVLTAVSYLCALLYSAKIRGRDTLKTMGYSFIIIALAGVFNMLFAHWGTTVVLALKHYDFTLESLLYGLHQGLMLCTVTVWLTLLGIVLDSGRLIYLFRFAPKLALIFSMVLGFIPRYLKKLNSIREAQKGLCGGEEPRRMKDKLKTAIQHFSALVSYCLESSIITADSMTARGYNPRAVRAGRYRVQPADILLFIILLFLSVFVMYEKAVGNIRFVFEPVAHTKALQPVALLCFFVLELIPTAVTLTEELRWKLSNLKA